MSHAEREPAGEEFDFSTGFRGFDRVVQPRGDQRKRDLLGRLAEQAAGLRANAMLLEEHIERLAHLTSRHRLG